MSRPQESTAVRPELGRWLAWLLRAGTLAAMALVAIGYGWAIAAGSDHGVPRPVVDEIAMGGGDAVKAIGLLTLTLVPIAVLAAAAIAFGRAGERRMTGTTLLVALLLIGSLLAAAVVGPTI